MDLKLDENETAHIWNVLTQSRIPGGVAKLHAGILEKLQPEYERLAKAQQDKQKKAMEDAQKAAETKKAK